MKRLASVSCICLVAFSAVGNVYAQTSPPPAPAPELSTAGSTAAIDPAKAAEIRKMIELTGMTKRMELVKTQMFGIFKSQQTGVSAQLWTRLDREADVNQLIEQMIPLYAKYYTLDDLKAANSFYESPAGQRILTVSPQIMSEAMKVGETWGRQIAVNVMAEIEAEKEAKAKANAAPGT